MVVSRIVSVHGGSDTTQDLLFFGAYPAIGQSEARQKRDAAKKLLVSDVDPALQLKQEKFARLGAGQNTFAKISESFFNNNEREGKADCGQADQSHIR